MNDERIDLSDISELNEALLAAGEGRRTGFHRADCLVRNAFCAELF